MAPRPERTSNRKASNNTTSPEQRNDGLVCPQMHREIEMEEKSELIQELVIESSENFNEVAFVIKQSREARNRKAGRLRMLQLWLTLVMLKRWRHKEQ